MILWASVPAPASTLGVPPGSVETCFGQRKDFQRDAQIIYFASSAALPPRLPSGPASRRADRPARRARSSPDVRPPPGAARGAVAVVATGCVVAPGAGGRPRDAGRPRAPPSRPPSLVGERRRPAEEAGKAGEAGRGPRPSASRRRRGTAPGGGGEGASGRRGRGARTTTGAGAGATGRASRRGRARRGRRRPRGPQLVRRFCRPRRDMLRPSRTARARRVEAERGRRTARRRRRLPCAPQGDRDYCSSDGGWATSGRPSPPSASNNSRVRPFCPSVRPSVSQTPPNSDPPNFFLATSRIGQTTRKKELLRSTEHRPAGLFAGNVFSVSGSGVSRGAARRRRRTCGGACTSSCCVGCGSCDPAWGATQGDGCAASPRLRCRTSPPACGIPGGRQPFSRA